MWNKRNKGITLVALIVTIIILLILAGVTIMQLTESGLFEKAKLAKEKHQNAEELENTTLSKYEEEIGKYISNDRSETDSSQFVELTADFSSGIAVFEYPEGYNKENTYIVSAKAYREDANAYYERYAKNGVDSIYLRDNDIVWELTVSGVSFLNAKILITKIDI